MHFNPRRWMAALPVLALGWNVHTLTAATVLYSDDFDADTSANWAVFNEGQNGTPDFDVKFSFDYSAVGIPAAPNTVGGTTRALRLTVNKNDDVADRAAVSLFPKDQVFGGNYALRFDMWMNYPGAAFGAGGEGSTEFSFFGLNFLGDKMSWPFSLDSDGLAFAATGEGGAAGDYRTFEGVTGQAMARKTGTAGGFLDHDGAGGPEDENFLLPKDHPLQVMFPTPPYESEGSPGKHWVEVEVRQENNEIVWSINGYEMSRRPNSSPWTGGNIMLGYMDVFASICIPKDQGYVLYDNVRVVSLEDQPSTTIVSVETVDATAAEPSGDNGSVLIRRAGGDQTQPLSVNIVTRGSATSGSDYKALPASVTIPANTDNVVVAIEVIDDLKGEKSEDVLVDVVPGAGYEVGAPFRGKVDIADDGDVTSVNVTAIDGLSYESVSLDTLSFQVTRTGDDTVPLVVNFGLGGTATLGSDYGDIGSSVTLAPGVSTTTVTFAPMDDAEVEGNETLVFTLLPGDGYVVGTVSPSATATLVDDDLPDGPVLFSDNFDTDSSANWKVAFGAANGIADSAYSFGYDYGVDGIPPSPHGAGSTIGLKATVNKQDAVASAASINFFPVGQDLKGDFSVRFDMFINVNLGAAGTTEHAIFGINHSGSGTNRHAAAGTDGLWFAVETDGSASSGRSYVSYYAPTIATAPTFLSKTATELNKVFTKPPYLAAGAASGRWVDVELRQVGDTVTCFINGTTIFTRTGTGFNHGALMLGHMDTFGSVGSKDNYTLFDNLRVINLSVPPPVVAIRTVGNSVQLEFTGVLEAADEVSGAYSPVDGAASPLRIEPGQLGTRKFYRARNP